MTTLPSVTEILAGVGLIDTDWFTEEARLKGSAVHRATELHDLGTLDEASVDDRIAGRFRQYRRFLMETGCEILNVEHEVRHSWGYVGHPDRLVNLGGRFGVLDIKGTTPCPWHALQLQGYKAAIRETGPTLIGRWNLYLSDDRYRLIERTNNREDDSGWTATFNLFQWRRKYDAVSNHGTLDGSARSGAQ